MGMIDDEDAGALSNGEHDYPPFKKACEYTARRIKTR